METPFDLKARARQALLARGFMPDFFPGTDQELARISEIKPPAHVQDLTHLLWSSIDNEDSRDLDQVEYAEPLPDGATRLLVGIADVASFIEIAGPIDQRAAHNTVTLYTAGNVFHLLPETLSTGMTSLNETNVRLGVVVEMIVPAEGAVRDPQVYSALLRNQARLSYDEVAVWAEHQCRVEKICNIPGLEQQLTLQFAASERLQQWRIRLGALSFSSSEARPVTRDGQVVDLKLVHQNRARDLIENLMIAANVAAATFLKSRGWPIIERVVRAPRDWERIRQIAESHGTTLPQLPAPKPLADFLQARKTQDPSGFRELSLSILKLLGGGEYVIETATGPQTSHFGLALDDYSHSTAPNRRYADQILQRLLLACSANLPNPYSETELEAIALRCTEREDSARKVERFMRKVAAAFILRHRIGEIFPAMVTGASAKGTYVRLKSPPVEGRVIRGDRSLLVGDRIHVRLLSVDPEKAFIDFERT